MALLRAAKLPVPVFNGWVEGYEVDVLWRRERVVLEFDSYTFHATRGAQLRDRATHGCAPARALRRAAHDLASS